MDFKDKTYVIAGGSSGIGLATADVLVKQGARVIIVGRNQEKLDGSRKTLGSDITTEVLDIADEQGVRSLFERMPLLDGIVCTAGHTPGSIDRMDTPSAKRGFDSKFFGQYFLVKYGLPKLKADSSVVLTSGVFSVRPVKDVGVLAAVNGAIESFVRAMAMELAPIRINAIAPGFIDTPRLKQVSARDPDSFAYRVNTQVPLKRVGEPEEAAHSVLYLLANSYTTGSVLYIDGGTTLR